MKMDVQIPLDEEVIEAFEKIRADMGMTYEEYAKYILEMIERIRQERPHIVY